jgi:hypothetical protein
MLNKTPKGMLTDHRNCNILDNGKENLRSCTRAQNRQNSRPTGKLRYKGVAQKQFNGKKYNQVSVQGKYIGLRENLIDAALLYDKHAALLYGEFAWLNQTHFAEVAKQKQRLEQQNYKLNS